MPVCSSIPFSRGSAEYARYRPRYPDTLIEHLARIAPRRDVAWDCGTGNGQAARALADRFALVLATDASASQLACAPSHPHVRYRTASAEASGIDDDAVDLVTVAQAMHWFDVDAFHREVRRVARADAIVAAWGYRLPSVDTDVDACLDAFQAEVAPYWPPERRHVEDAYAALAWPYVPLPAPDCEMRADLDLDGLLGYLATWTAVRRYREQRCTDPVPRLRAALGEVWGAVEDRRSVRWPMFVRIGRFAV